MREVAWKQHGVAARLPARRRTVADTQTLAPEHGSERRHGGERLARRR
jgi:hypothetical protein